MSSGNTPSPNRRRFLRTARAVGIGIALAGCTDSPSGGRSDSGNAIKLGTLAPNSGTFSSSGPYVQAGNKLAAQRINKEGGINGKKVKIVTADTQTDPKAGASAATRLIQQENVDLL